MKGISEGIFITFEGIEGSGKSTQMNLLAEYLKGKGYDVVVTREPGGTAVGDSVRSLVLNPNFSKMNSRTELLLNAASRTELVSEIIKPALEAGKIVLCDRFADSSLAYQGFGRGISLDEIERLNKWATLGLSPQLTIFLSIPAQCGLDRATRISADRIEKEAIEFHQKVKNGYDHLAKKYPNRIRLVDAVGSPKKIHRKIVEIVEEFLEKEEQR
jgi:dTMP kinase